MPRKGCRRGSSRRGGSNAGALEIADELTHAGESRARNLGELLLVRRRGGRAGGCGGVVWVPGVKFEELSPSPAWLCWGVRRLRIQELSDLPISVRRPMNWADTTGMESATRPTLISAILFVTKRVVSVSKQS
ncbi:uncharacterized protein PG998_000123 [Apiospora kogelbergensis]|uniref:uncharacterized protein n=1 Tax=Apiospora kogelbergensis TaxID=1337665 RepID=UPI003130A070